VKPMEQYVVKEGKKLRLGYTTGSCAAAAAKAAAYMLLTGRRMETIRIRTPKGIVLNLEVLEIRMEPDRVSCAIAKDSGDDPDVTEGTLIFAEASRSGTPGVSIDGGRGVGRVTKKGLDQPVGAAAINSTPRRMIRENVEEVCRFADYHGGVSIVIFAPDGERLAKKTFNPRLGIVGGISILGTTGIVDPMSEQALIDTIRVELRQRRENGTDYVLLTPGNYGSDYIQDELKIDPKTAVLTSNYIGDTLDICRELGFQGALLVGHVGKLVKIAGGMLNTHSKYGDCRMEILAANAGAAGLPSERIAEMLECAACDDAIRILKECGCFEQTMERITGRISFIMDQRTAGEMKTGAILFSKEYGFLGETKEAGTLLKYITEE
jgi:cobalt-precorrin-5B (C1)-methyltransferase